MNSVKLFGKFLDQPVLISKLNKAKPAIMGCGATLLFANNAIDIYKASQDKKEAKKEILKKGVVMAASVASALLAPKIASKITKHGSIDSLDAIKQRNQELIKDFLSKNQVSVGIAEILKKAKNEILSLSEIKKLALELSQNKNGEEFFNKLIPDPENIKAKDIFSEIGYLSVYGAIPVVGGILGGICADKLTNEDCKKTVPDKINEGVYQYLANIFMCNIGAGAALGLLEKLNIKSKSARAVGMVSGIILAGVLGGSKIANFVSEKVICPLAKIQPKERKPEPLDVCLHTDDIATVSLLSGLKWIEPALPVLYSVSGYKAGVGYRN